MEIVALDALKATQRVDTPTKIIENSYKIFPIFFSQANFNNAIETSTLPEWLKYADVKTVFKKESWTRVKSVRIFPHSN